MGLTDGNSLLTKIFNFVRPTLRFVRHPYRGFANLYYSPQIKKSAHNFKLIRLGSRHGGWTLVDSKSLRESVVVSCGLGEDASFDVELANRFAAKVVIVDPTPRAVRHFQQITERYGLPATNSYMDKGAAQNPAAYDLSQISPKRFDLVQKAVWNKNGTVKFFAPKNHNHVSHSIVNFQHNWSSETDHMEVPAITFSDLLREQGIKDLPLVKFDIEGAEIEVLEEMMEKEIYPSQILVEFDEITVPSKRSKDRIEKTHRNLVDHGYQLLHVDGPSNFLYARPSGLQ
jgi:FkbM family methyltransferase